MSNKAMIAIEVLIALIVFSLAVMVVFLWVSGAGDWQGDIDKEVCHQSAIIRATVPDELTAGKKLVETPLKCKTEKICITTNLFFKGGCEEELGKNYNTIRVSSDSLKIENEINAILADSAADGCWGMLGEGRISVFSREIERSRGKNCVVCSRIAFDKSVFEHLPDKENKKIHGLLRYIISTKMKNSDKTYWQYLTNSLTPSVPYTSEIQEKDFLDLNQNQKAIVFYEVGRGSLGEIAGKGGGAIAGAAAGLTIGAIVGSVAPIAGTFLGGGIGLISGGVLGYFGYSVGEKLHEEYGEYFDGWDKKDIKSYGGYAIINYTEESLNGLDCSFQNLVS